MPLSLVRRTSLIAAELARHAWTSVLSHPLRSGLGILAMASAVATVSLVVTATDGIAAYTQATAARTFGSDTFVVAKIGAPGTLSRRELERRLERNPPLRRQDLRFLEQHAQGAVVYAPSMQRAADVTAAGRKFENAAVTGTAATLSEIRDLALERGRFLVRADEVRAAQVAVVGFDVARELFPGLDPLGRSVRIAGRGFEVVGVQNQLGTAAGTNLDRYVWIPAPTYDRVFGAPDTITLFARAPAGASTTLAEDTARTSLRARRRLAPGTADNFDLLAPEAGRGFVLRLTKLVSSAGVPIALMALLAAAIVVANTTLVSVTQRTREIGVRRAIGARRRQILGEVLAESVLVALAGAVLGVGAVALVASGVERGLSFPLEVSASAAAFAIAAAGATGVCAGWYPARLAARVDVIAALRAE